jgi:hypothetical protein
MSADPSVSADSQVRRRIVSAPRRTVTPLALITRDPQNVATLVEKLKLSRPVVTFPSLAHFCTDRQRSERWAGIIVGQACAWDARLDDYVLDRDCIALYGEDEGYGWPEAVYRLRSGDLDTWMATLDLPRERVPLRTREKREKKEGETRQKRSKSVFSLWSPDKVVTVDSNGGASTQANGSTPALPAAQAKPTVVRTVVSANGVRAAVRKTPQQQTLPFVDASAAQTKKGRAVAAAEKPVETRAKVAEREKAEREKAERHRAEVVRDVVAWSTSKRGARSKAELSRAEEKLVRLAAEIGLVHARDLLEQLRARALDLVR